MDRSIKHLVTSGCSFSDNHKPELGKYRWPHYLAEYFQAQLYNFGHGSAGNDHIANSIIFKTNELLSQGIAPKDIAVFAMWSGIDRTGHFISQSETTNYIGYINTNQKNPINFLTMTDHRLPGWFLPNDRDASGWLLGSPHCSWDNPEITRLKSLYFENFFTMEDQMFKSLNYMLQVQWFCEAKGIFLRNLCYKEILENPFRFKTCTHLYNMLDLNTWIFWQFNLGLYEYTRDNQLAFDSDGFHPHTHAHRHFVFNYLVPRL